jgi:hypothetical protein
MITYPLTIAEIRCPATIDLALNYSDYIKILMHKRLRRRI